MLPSLIPEDLIKYAECDYSLGNSIHSDFYNYLKSKKKPHSYIKRFDVGLQLFDELFELFRNVIKNNPGLEISCLQVGFSPKLMTAFVKFKAKTKEEIEGWKKAP